MMPDIAAPRPAPAGPPVDAGLSAALPAPRVLLVDDEPMNRELLVAYLTGEGYDLAEASTGQDALRTIAAQPPDLVVLDAMMPGMDGFAVCRQLKSAPQTRLIPVVMVTALIDPRDRLRGIEAGVDDFLTKPANRPELLTRLRSLLRAKRYLDELESAEGIILSLATAIAIRDGYTGEHTERVSERASILGGRLGLAPQTLRVLRLGALLHDIGKIGVPESVLGKPGRLIGEELALMRLHPLLGVEICRPLRSSLISACLPIIRSHHERIDGAGYPDGLAGDAIPLLARIAAISDAYDAMTSARPYRDPLPPERARRILREGAGTQWDAALVEEFLHLPALLLAS